jgi:hypothetical protein
MNYAPHVGFVYGPGKGVCRDFGQARAGFNRAFQAIEINWQSWPKSGGFRAAAGLNFFAPAGPFHCYIQ